VVTPSLDDNHEFANIEVISLSSIRGDDESVQKDFFEKVKNDERRKLDKIGVDLL